MEDWQVGVAKASAAALARCENETTRTAPKVALCVAGSARSFATPVVLTHLYHNLLVPLAGDRPERVRLFLHLKLNDSEKIAGLAGQRFHSHRENSLASIAAALQLPWMRSRLGEAVLLNGSGSYAGGGCSAHTDAGSCVVQPSTSAWTAYRTRACSADALARRNASGESATANCCAPQNKFIATGNNEERLLLSHLAIGWCGESIPRYERARAMSFDLVVYTRPDAVWMTPVTPWCKWAWDAQMIMCDGPACDMAWMVPRAHFERFARQHEMHRDCPARPNTRGRHICCTTSEHLLTFARTHRNATHLLPPSGQVRMSAAASGHSLKSITVLRSVRGVCEIVMNPVLSVEAGITPSNAAGGFAFRHEQKSGLLVRTTMYLRRLFVRNESETRVDELAAQMRACRSGLSFYTGVASGAAREAGEEEPPRLPVFPPASASLDLEWAQKTSQKLRAWRGLDAPPPAAAAPPWAAAVARGRRGRSGGDSALNAPAAQDRRHDERHQPSPRHQQLHLKHQPHQPAAAEQLQRQHSAAAAAAAMEAELSAPHGGWWGCAGCKR